MSLNIFAQKDFKRFDFESAYAKKITTTKMTGVDIETIQEIYISGSGSIMATYQTEKKNITMANIVEENKSVTIVDGDWSITYDPETRTGTKIKIDLADKFSGMSNEDMLKMAEQMKESTGTETEDIGTKVIAGQTCTGTRATTNLMGMKTVSEIWMFGNLVMESNSTGIANVEEKIIEFVLGANYDKTRLQVPSDVEITKVKSPF
jgi:outer membrane lipoprotein-sorting protein